MKLQQVLAVIRVFETLYPNDDYDQIANEIASAAELSAAGACRQIHCHAVAAGLSSDVNVATALVRTYSVFGFLRDARNVFDETTSKTHVALWNAMLAGYAKAGDVESAQKVFDEMPERNLVSWTVFVSGFVQARRPREAARVFERMWVDGAEPDEVTMLAVVSACAQLGSLGSGKRVHGYVVKRGFFSSKLAIGNALIDMYAKSGSVRDAKSVFEAVGERRNAVTYTAMISGLALHGLGDEAAKAFSRMESDSVEPNGATFLSLLSALSRAAMVDTARRYFDEMGSRYKIRPGIEHYGCVIDSLGRAGRLDEAIELTKSMPFEPNAAVWGSLLSASNVYRDTELGERALRHLVALEPWNSGNNMLLANTYDSHGGYDESGVLRKAMRDSGVKKTPGWSSVEVDGNKFRRFVAGDTSNPDFLAAFEVLNRLNVAAGLPVKEVEFLELHT